MAIGNFKLLAIHELQERNSADAAARRPTSMNIRAAHDKLSPITAYGSPLVPTRRSLLQSAAVLSATSVAPRVIFAADPVRSERMSVIYDSRRGESRSFGGRASHLDFPTHAIEGDITDLWQTELQALWKQAPVTIAGLTERPALFLLEQLGWDYGLRVVYQAEHGAPEPNGTEHRIVRSVHPGLRRELEAAGSMWPHALAGQILTAPREVASNDYTPSGAAMAAFLGEPPKLHSWIIAPRSAA